jgi:DMSO/TMAO reductase YedYZ molybdopterin-dependent catalytic subunit
VRDEVLLAYEMNGQPLPPQHGAPLRLVVPGWYGMAHVKWLRDITVVTGAFDGFQNATAYRLKVDPDEAGEPVTRIRPRALMVPPGFPDFMTRTRFVGVGEHRIQGRAWSGWAPVTRVEVSADGGHTWTEAELGPASSRYAWRAWSFPWRVTEPGTYELAARARDAVGNVQPTDQPWNRQGMANNLVQRVNVVVRGG